MSVEAFKNVATANPEGPMSCMGKLFGDKTYDELATAVDSSVVEGLDSQAVADIISNPANGAVKTAIQKCLTELLTDPTRNPIDKQWLAEVIQGSDLDNDTKVG